MQYAACIIIFACLSTVSAAQPVFTEDFEEASLQDMAARWSEAKNLAGMEFSSDIPPGSPGTQSLMMTAVIGENTGGHLYKMLPQGYDSLYARFYVKFSATHNPVHHFVHMGGYNPPIRWPQGGAGERPVGNERFTSGIEPFGQRWEWDFYSYWMHMRGNPVPNRYWGNNFLPQPPVPVTRGKWQCVEIMMKCNSPISAYNGMQALWVDGQKALHLRQGSPNGYWVWDTFHHHPDSAGFEGFQWRNHDNLKLNFFWLLYYMTAGPQGQKDTVWFDDVVVSGAYTGPHTTTSVAALPTARELLVETWPNPFTETVQIRASAEGQVSIYDIYGRLVETMDASGPQSTILTWRPAAIPKGMYYLRFTGQGKQFVQPLLYR